MAVQAGNCARCEQDDQTDGYQHHHDEGDRTVKHSASLATVENAKLVRLANVTSTQDVARDLPIGSIVVTDHQSAGRGRFDRRWEAPTGSALLVSFVLEPNPLLSLVAGVAAAEACGANVRLKWPNDLLLDGGKLGGILVEVTHGKAVCGIGINLTSAPPGASMLRRSRDELLEVLRVRIAEWRAKSPDEVLARWRRLSETLGRRVRVDLPGQSIEGMAEDIGPQGELIVDGVAYVSGSVRHLP